LDEQDKRLIGFCS